MAHTIEAALAAHHAGRLDEAERLYRRILRAEPEHFDALHCLGIIQHQAGRNERALGFFERALRTNRQSSQLHNNRAATLNALNRAPEALASLDQALALNPRDPTLHYNRGNTLMTLQRDAEALASFTRAVTLNPAFLPAWQNRAVTETRLGMHEAALATCDRLIALQPGAALPHRTRAEALLALHRPAEAIADLEAAAADPGLENVGVNRAYALHAAGRGGEAMQAVDAALATNPELALAHWNAASICLALGDYGRGWREYEWRWSDPSFRGKRRAFPQPLWLGAEPLAGRTILLHAEQGFGDTIQFCRYVPLVKAYGARVLLEAPPPLLPLLQTLAGMDELIPWGAPLPEFDMHCPLMSLPLAFGTTLGTIPDETPYLAADPARAALWSGRLGPPRGPRIGLAWSGSAVFKGDVTRSAPLSALSGLIRPGFDYVALQKDIRPADAQAARALGVRMVSQHITDFAEAAALTSVVDLTISVDSAPAHLAGALGQPVWLLLHNPAEWRWLRDRSDSPWYPTARLFRQTTALDWPELAARAGDALDRWRDQASNSAARNAS